MSKKNNEIIISTILTIVQYTTLPALLFLLTWISSNLYLMIIQIIGFVIAAWAILEMAKSKLNISPTPRENAILITSGPYKFVRHPMYLSLILTIVPAIISYYNQTAVLVFIIVIRNLFLKMMFEEGLLKNYFGDSYLIYMKKSWRLFPYIF